MELWFACWTGKEIAEECGCSEQAVNLLVSPKEFQKTFLEKPAAQHATDFEPPIYNVWKRRHATPTSTVAIDSRPADDRDRRAPGRRTYPSRGGTHQGRLVASGASTPGRLVAGAVALDAASCGSPGHGCGPIRDTLGHATGRKSAPLAKWTAGRGDGWSCEGSPAAAGRSAAWWFCCGKFSIADFGLPCSGWTISGVVVQAMVIRHFVGAP